ncbi:MAG TPA: biopolymer transporter ExbD [Gemmatimonadales bacterium]
MSRRRRASRLQINADINVVNLIDVMLLLMVIFMITAPMMQGGVDVALPRADVAPMEAKRGLIVSVTRAGEIVVDDDTRLSEPEFEAAFAALAAGRTAGGVYLRADQAVPYGTVVRVLATMRRAGVGDVGLVAEPEEVR